MRTIGTRSDEFKLAMNQCRLEMRRWFLTLEPEVLKKLHSRSMGTKKIPQKPQLTCLMEPEKCTNGTF